MWEADQVNGHCNLEWLNNSYLNKILTEYEGQPIELRSFDVIPATSKGENYGSAMNLVTAEYNLIGGEDLKKISMIFKSRLKHEFMEELEKEFNVFERETQMYRCIMTACEKLLRNIGDNTIFGPRAIYLDDRVIVQENLKENGYHILDVKKRLDYEECKKVLEKVAKLHATTMVLYQQNPELFKYHRKGNVSEIQTPLHDFYKNSLKTCVEFVKTIPELQKYQENLAAFCETVIEKLIDVFNINTNGINVLNHGDLWVNNLMFKKDSNGKALDILLVDYQEGFFGSPGIDLNYFIYSSWKMEVYLNKKDDLIKYYHNILLDTLKSLQYTEHLPTLEDIYREIRLKGQHGLATVTCLLPVFLNEYEEMSEAAIFLEDTEENRKNRLIIFNNKNYVEYLKIFLKDFVCEGIL